MTPDQENPSVWEVGIMIVAWLIITALWWGLSGCTSPTETTARVSCELTDTVQPIVTRNGVPLMGGCTNV